MPTTDDLHAILKDLTTAQRALRKSTDALNTAIAQMSGLLGAIGAVNREQSKAIDAIVAVTDRALTALNDSRPWKTE